MELGIAKHALLENSGPALVPSTIRSARIVLVVISAMLAEALVTLAPQADMITIMT
jgi:hypothetical protein